MKADSIGMLARALSPATRILGLDLGTRTIGLALSDLGLTVATGYDTIRRVKFSKDFKRLETVIEREGVGGLVIGYPIELDGTQGKACHRVHAFTDEVLKRRPIPVLYWDERLSTAAAERILIGAADLSRKRRAEVVDKTAAGIILQGALDALNHAGESDR